MEIDKLVTNLTDPDEAGSQLFAELSADLRELTAEVTSDSLERIFTSATQIPLEAELEAIAQAEGISLQLLKDLIQNRPQLEESLDLSAAELPAAQRGGAHADYDNPVKQQWRRAWAEFLERNLPKEGRDKLKVLCLPSKNPSREISLYLDLGILPENIIGVEGDPSAREEFERNANALGIQPIFGRLENVVPRLADRIDIISLDFLGPICPAYIKILKALPIAEKFYLLVNVRGGREQTSTQNLLVDANEKLIESDWVREHERIATIARQLEAFFDLSFPEIDLDIEEKINTATDYPTVRERLFDNIVAANVGSDRAPRHAALHDFSQAAIARARDHGHDNLRAEHAAKISIDLFKRFRQVLLGDIGQTIKLLNVDNPCNRGDFTVLSHVFFYQSLTMATFMQDMERIKYYSEVSKTHSPYVSTFIAGVVPYKNYQKWAPAAQFLSSVLKIRMSLDPTREPNEIGSFGFAYKGSTAVVTPKKLGGQLDLCFFDKRKILVRVPAQVFMTALSEFARYVNDYSFEEHWINGIPRRVLRGDGAES